MKPAVKHKSRGLTISEKEKVALFNLFVCGSFMSNVLFNFSQLDEIPEGYRKTMEIRRKQWDEAKGKALKTISKLTK